MPISLTLPVLPTAGELAPYVARLHQATGETLADATDATVERILLEDHATDRGWASSEHSTTAVVTVSWTWDSFTRGPRQNAVTLIQTETGYRTGGEGSIVVETHAWQGSLAENEARTLVDLIRRGGAPVQVEWREE